MIVCEFEEALDTICSRMILQLNFWTAQILISMQSSRDMPPYLQATSRNESVNDETQRFERFQICSLYIKKVRLHWKTTNYSAHLTQEKCTNICEALPAALALLPIISVTGIS